MATAHIFQTLIDYHYSLYERLWDSIDQLTDAQFTQEIDYAHGSIRNQMVHVAVVDTRWFKGLTGQPDARTFTLDPAEYPTRDSVRALWNDIAQKMQRHAQLLADDDLAQTLPGMLGPTWQILAQVVNHGTDHRAQILSALHQFGAPTFDQDLIGHLWFSG